MTMRGGDKLYSNVVYVMLLANGNLCYALLSCLDMLRHDCNTDVVLICAVNARQRTPCKKSVVCVRGSPLKESTSTRLAARKQSKLPFKCTKAKSNVGSRTHIDTAKLMYRSNMAGVIKTVVEVKYDKLCGTILERYTLSVANNDEVAVRNENTEFVVHMEEEMNEASNVDVVLENTEVSFDCWRPDSPYGGNVDSEPPRPVFDQVTNVVKQKGKRSGRVSALEDCLPKLFPDLLELSSTPAADGDGGGERLEADLRNALLRNKELEADNKRKSVQLNELEARVDVMERIIGKKAVNLFIGFENISTSKDAEIARLEALVRQLDGKVASLEDQVDDHETHAVTQSAAHIESMKRQTNEDQVERYGSCNDSHVSRSERSSVFKALRSTSTIPKGAVCIDVGDAVEVESPLRKTPSEINCVSGLQGCPAAAVVESFADCAVGVEGNENANMAVIWDGGDNGMRVYFSDIQALVQQACVSGKVIDAYAAILTVLQRDCAVDDNNVDSSFFFSSICAKQWVVKFHNRSVGVGARTTNVAPPYIDGTLESVMDCPQQAADTVDCAMIVCFLMRQYVQKVEINTTMDGVTTTAYRASMVSTFVNDPVRGLRSRCI
ncbi:hypothetical protein LOK49_LG14G01360 [Camellia lanceoleosa]|uniref:Uncharacterized protein n=1 Tax=Camellia lanceoleosa TaxID=1840588 RepID=A0ACC0FDY2_9ERIC|nr:hypothetical protein LOK49_LG14G01360 [Camellia lanceoleosa]